MKTVRATKWRYGWFIVSLLALLSTALFGFTAWGENDPAPVPEIPWEVEVYREYWTSGRICAESYGLPFGRCQSAAGKPRLSGLPGRAWTLRRLSL